MTSTFTLNLIASLFIVAALIAVCRLAFLVAGGLLHRPDVQEERPFEESDRLVA